MPGNANIPPAQGLPRQNIPPPLPEEVQPLPVVSAVPVVEEKPPVLKRGKKLRLNTGLRPPAKDIPNGEPEMKPVVEPTAKPKVGLPYFRLNTVDATKIMENLPVGSFLLKNTKPGKDPDNSFKIFYKDLDGTVKSEGLKNLE